METPERDLPSRRAAGEPARTPPAPIGIPPAGIPQPAKPDGLDWVGTIFRIEGAGPTLVVSLQAESSSWNMQKLQIEVNALRRKFETGAFKNLILDLAGVDYFGSELIGALIRLGRTATDRKGKAAFCSPSPQMLQVLESMRLSKLWPIVPTRAEALASVAS